MILSFGHTTPALLAGVKTVTRRDWKPQHAAKFHEGMMVDAWNTSPRNVKLSPRKVATIRLRATPTLESTEDAPESDWEAEGFRYLYEHNLKVFGLPVESLWVRWRLEPQHLYVVRFELVSVEPGA